MGASVSTQDIALVICLSVVFALTALFSGYLAYLCTRDPDRIRRRASLYFMDSHLSDAFVRTRLLARYRRALILSAILAITLPVAVFGVSLWWCPVVIGMVVLVVAEIATEERKWRS